MKILKILKKELKKLCFRLSLQPMVLILTSIFVIEVVAAIGLGIYCYYSTATDQSGTLPFFLHLLFGTNAAGTIKKPIAFPILLNQFK